MFVILAGATAVTVAGGAVVDTTPAGHEEQVYGAIIIAALPDIEVTGDHADAKHPEAPYVRKTCKERGVYQIYRESIDKNTFHLLCMDENGKLVDWIIKVVGNRFIEKTAFRPHGGNMNAVIKYASSKGTRFSKGW
jgi:hypothetical protein